MRRHPEPGLQARLLVKRAARRLLRRAGYRAALPSAGMLLAAEPSGRPRLELSPEAAAWLEQREFAVSVSLAHAGAQVMGVALIGRNIL